MDANYFAVRTRLLLILCLIAITIEAPGQPATNEAKTFEEAKMRARIGDAKDQFYLGQIFLTGAMGAPKDMDQAVRWTRMAAEQGLPEAEEVLGALYQRGQGVSRDAAEAVRWYRKAAEKGFAEAQRALANCYDFGDGVAKDEVESAKWYRKAAEQGLAAAQYALGVCYANGDGVPKDYAESFRWH